MTIKEKFYLIHILVSRSSNFEIKPIYMCHIIYFINLLGYKKLTLKNRKIDFQLFDFFDFIS
jgi:hypothetical protein